jgi:hypothetical protein
MVAGRQHNLHATLAKPKASRRCACTCGSQRAHAMQCRRGLTTSTASPWLPPACEADQLVPAPVLSRPPSSDRTLLLVACACASSRMAASMSPRRSNSWLTPAGGQSVNQHGMGWVSGQQQQSGTVLQGSQRSLSCAVCMLRHAKLQLY